MIERWVFVCGCGDEKCSATLTVYKSTDLFFMVIDAAHTDNTFELGRESARVLSELLSDYVKGGDEK